MPILNFMFFISMFKSTIKHQILTFRLSTYQFCVLDFVGTRINADDTDRA